MFIALRFDENHPLSYANTSSYIYSIQPYQSVNKGILLTRVKKSVNKRTAGIRSSVGREPSKENSWVRCEVRPAESCAITHFPKINYFFTRNIIASNAKTYEAVPELVKHTHRDIINILLDPCSRCALVSYGLMFFPFRPMALFRAQAINRKEKVWPVLYATHREDELVSKRYLFHSFIFLYLL